MCILKDFATPIQVDQYIKNILFDEDMSWFCEKIKLQFSHFSLKL